MYYHQPTHNWYLLLKILLLKGYEINVCYIIWRGKERKKDYSQKITRIECFGAKMKCILLGEIEFDNLYLIKSFRINSIQISQSSRCWFVSLFSVCFCRVYQFSKRNALEDGRQQIVLSMVARTRLEAQRRLLVDKLETLGSKDAPLIGLDDDRISVTSSNSVSPLSSH